MRPFAAALLAVCAAVCAQPGSAQPQPNTFYLKSGDKVVFYGDSITEQRLYTALTEAFVDTRYPGMSVTFVNSGWGGDRVSGGGGGPIDTRLKRDLLPFSPTVVTILLGMNDGGYKPATAATDEAYYTGYRHIVDTIRTSFPNARVTALAPSPYDDVTRTYSANGLDHFEYNQVLRGFSGWIKEYAPTAHLDTADMNSDMVDVLRRANTVDVDGSKTIIPDRVHPSFAGHLLMAEALLKAWGARPVVSEVTIEASHHGAAKLAGATDAQVSELSGTGDSLHWTELDDALPLPFAQWSEQWGAGPVALVLKSSDLAQALNRETLKIAGLRAGTYAIKIDDMAVGSFSADQLAAGVNLGMLKTPSTEQALKVYHLVTEKEDVHFDWWRHIQVPLAEDNLPESASAITSLQTLETALANKIHQAAQPASHRYEVSRLE